MGSPLAKNNAFGIGSPSWNLSFPSGNVTAAELLAYLPHWLKSIDVIDRLVTNGGKSYTIAAIVNEFRYLPGDVFKPNSCQIMMSYGMRRAGFDEWTVGTHHQFQRPNPEMDEYNLNVQTFRAPRTTHPKSAPPGQTATKLKHNEEADPVEFKSLALHVRKHPAGPDALDLSRCVQYAVAHPDEEWYFPNDFADLVTKLGGSAPVTHSHLDRQIFSRREDYIFRSPVKTPGSQSIRTPTSKRTGSAKVMPQSRKVTGRSATPASGSPLKRMMTADDMTYNGSRRKSGRLVGKASINFKEYESDAEDNDTFGSPYSGHDTPTKKRKLNRIPAPPDTPPNDGDFVQDKSESDEDAPEAEIISDDEPISPVNAARSRAAARKARQTILDISTATQRNLDHLRLRESTRSSQSSLMLLPLSPSRTASRNASRNAPIDPDMMKLARTFSPGAPLYLQPPTLSANRLRVDASTLYLYAADGCTSRAEMWVSALSSTRFNGPRRHSPFRELHRLTDPLPWDMSDWAENIRWAKEQWRVFGSETWTEYDAHLEMITEWRRGAWASEEAVRMG